MLRSCCERLIPTNWAPSTLNLSYSSKRQERGLARFANMPLHFGLYILRKGSELVLNSVSLTSKKISLCLNEVFLSSTKTKQFISSIFLPPSIKTFSTEIAQPPQKSKSIAERLRYATRKVHAEMHKHPFTTLLLHQGVPVKTYGLYLTNLLALYSSLEKILIVYKEHRSCKPLYLPETFRTEALKTDLKALKMGDLIPTSAAKEYVKYLTQLSTYKPHLIAAHAYARVLGDLNGGQIIARKLSFDQLDLSVPTAFYTFDQIPNMNAFIEQYRQALNSLPLTEAEVLELENESIKAFEWHHRMFDEL